MLDKQALVKNRQGDKVLLRTPHKNVRNNNTIPRTHLGIVSTTNLSRLRRTHDQGSTLAVDALMKFQGIPTILIGIVGELQPSKLDIGIFEQGTQLGHIGRVAFKGFGPFINGRRVLFGEAFLAKSFQAERFCLPVSRAGRAPARRSATCSSIRRMARG